MEEYGGLFAEAGFRLVEAREEYGELITLAAWVAKSLHVGMKDVGIIWRACARAGKTGPGSAMPEMRTGRGSSASHIAK
jgi:hypothetical protein